MTPDRFRECLGLLRWSQRGLADLIGMDERQVRRIATGAAAADPELADWLERAAGFFKSNPPPSRRKAAMLGVARN